MTDDPAQTIYLIGTNVRPGSLRPLYCLHPFFKHWPLVGSRPLFLLELPPLPLKLAYRR